MFTVGGSYATLNGSKALISGCILGVSAFFFALQHSYGFLQSTYSKRRNLLNYGESRVIINVQLGGCDSRFQINECVRNLPLHHC